MIYKIDTILINTNSIWAIDLPIMLPDLANSRSDLFYVSIIINGIELRTSAGLEEVVHQYYLKALELYAEVENAIESIPKVDMEV